MAILGRVWRKLGTGRSVAKCLRQLVLILAVFILTYILTTYRNMQHEPFIGRDQKRGITLASTNESHHSESNNITNVTYVTQDIHKTDMKTGGGLNPTKLKEVFRRGEWNSSFVSEYHKHYPVNCAAIIRGEKQAIAGATHVLKTSNKNIPDDNAVKNWTSDCVHYRAVRKYPAEPQSVEEADFPIAYLIVTHADSSQLERLLRAIYQPQNVYCIHPDAKSPAPFQNAVRTLAACFPNVFIVSRPVNVHYEHSSRLQADVNCMKDLLLRPEPWRYVINLCAQDFPLKTNLEIVRQLKAFQGHNDIPGITAPWWFTKRTHVHHEFRNNMLVKLPDITKPPPPQDFKFFFGNAYYAATKDFVHYVIHNQTAIELLKYSEDAFSPDEHYWVTLHRIPGVPGGYPVSSWNSTVRFIHWKGQKAHPDCVGKYVRNICIFGTGYVRYLATEGKLFANKFYMSFDPIAVQCLEELLDYRTVLPDTVSDFVPNFPAKHMFGL